jgi:hypothetical protein
MQAMSRLPSPPMHIRPVTLVLASLVATCAMLAPHLAGATPEEPPRAALDDARKAATELVTSVRGELVKAIEASGPLRAIAVCKYAVPEIASSVSRKYGARVMRVTLTPRNPALGGADAWEQRVLMGFEERVARGEKADGMEHFEVVNEPVGKFMRYARALPVQPVCMNCHGPAEQVSESIRNQISHDYPHDRAMVGSVGKVRGAVSYKKPL